MPAKSTFTGTLRRRLFTLCRCLPSLPPHHTLTLPLSHLVDIAPLQCAGFYNFRPLCKSTPLYRPNLNWSKNNCLDTVNSCSYMYIYFKKATWSSILRRIDQSQITIFFLRSMVFWTLQILHCYQRASPDKCLVVGARNDA